MSIFPTEYCKTFFYVTMVTAIVLATIEPFEEVFIKSLIYDNFLTPIRIYRETRMYFITHTFL